MADDQKQFIEGTVKNFGNDPERLMDIVREVQSKAGCISEESAHHIAKLIGIKYVEVIDMVSFYSFLERTPGGKSVVRLSSCVVDKMHGLKEVADAFEKHTGTKFGSTGSDGEFTLEYTSCTGMCDQGPAALVNGQVLTNIKPKDVRGIVESLRKGDIGSESSNDVRPDTQVDLNLRKTGSVIFSPMDHGVAIRAAINLDPEQVIAHCFDVNNC